MFIRFRKLTLKIAIAIILAIFLSACSEAPKPIVIGAVLVMTDSKGTPVINGQHVVRGVNLAIETLNENGGLDGRPFTLSLKDCRMNPELAREQFEELAAQGASVIISNYSHISLGLISTATKTKVPQLAIMATAEGLTKDAPYTFRYWTQSSDQAKALLPLVKKLRVKSLGLINIDNTYGNSVSRELKQSISRSGIKVTHVTYDSIKDNLPIKVAQLGNVDAISFTCFPDDILPLSEVIRNIYPDVDLIGPMSIASPELFENKSLEGIYSSAPLIYHVAKHQNKKFYADYAEKYDAPADVYSAIGYDSIMLLYNVFEEVGISTDAVTQFLNEGFTYPGLFGDVFGRPGSHHFSFPLQPAQLQNGKLTFARR